MADKAKSLRPAPPDPAFPDEPPADPADEAAAQLERLKWFGWHGSVFSALQTIDDLISDLDAAEPAPIGQVRLLRAGRCTRVLRCLPARERRPDPGQRGALPRR